MESSLLACPICTQPGFINVDSLCHGLICASTREFVCPECNELLRGLDKFTIHLFSHSIRRERTCKDVQFCHSKDVTTKSIDIHSLNLNKPVCLFKSLSDFHISTNNNNNNNYATTCKTENGTTTPTRLKQQHNLQDLVPPIEMTCESSVKETYCVSQNLSHNRGEKTSIKFPRCDKFTSIASRDLHLDHFKVPIQIENRSETASAEFVVNSVGLPNKTSESFKILEDHEEPSALVCEICQFSFTDDTLLDIHKQLIHSAATIETCNAESEVVDANDGKNYTCLLCPKSFRMRGSLMVHMRVAHNGLPSGKLKSVRQTEHNTQVDRNYTCSVCDKTFKKESHLTQHMKTHDGKQWSCDVCNKLFTTKYFLKKHKRLHTGEMPYRCGICDKTFTFQQSYHKHLLYHSDEKPHVCSECDRAFKELSTLHNHQRIHTGEKPFACETCGKCFRQRVSYLVHCRIHTGVMPYRCTACGKHFRYKVSQRTHRCPSQPPGIVVRQSSELVQKLRQAVEEKPQQLEQSAGDGSEQILKIGKESILSEKQHLPLKQQQTAETHQNNQYIIVTNSEIQSSPPVVWITGKTEKSHIKKTNHKMLQEQKLIDASSSQLHHCLDECCNTTISVNCREKFSEQSEAVNEQGFIYICKDNISINLNNKRNHELNKYVAMNSSVLNSETGTSQSRGIFYTPTEPSNVLNVVIPSSPQSAVLNNFCVANDSNIPVALNMPVVVQNNVGTINFLQETENFSTEYILGKSNLKSEPEMYNSNTGSTSHVSFTHQNESVPVGQSNNLELSHSLLVLNEESLNLF